MKPKQILTVVLLLFVVSSLAYMVGSEQKTDSKSDEVTDNSAQAKKQNETENITESAEERKKNLLMKTVDNNARQKERLIVYYFHGNVRCPTCHKLETYAKEALELYFADELKSGNIILEIVDVDKLENGHFIEDYKLVTKSVVISEIKDGRQVKWENLDRIWQKVRDKDSYLAYIRDSIQNFLSEGRQ